MDFNISKNVRGKCYCDVSEFSHCRQGVAALRKLFGELMNKINLANYFLAWRWKNFTRRTIQYKLYSLNFYLRSSTGVSTNVRWYFELLSLCLATFWKDSSAEDSQGTPKKKKNVFNFWKSSSVWFIVASKFQIEIKIISHYNHKQYYHHSFICYHWISMNLICLLKCLKRQII